MSRSLPRHLTLRSYQVGFGDCFLLSFHYRAGSKHVLIDFGSTGYPKNAPSGLAVRIAKLVKEHCDGKLHGVVATHRHKDHISGFATNAKGTGPGDIIATCDPDVIVQPWTEDPDAAIDATRPTTVISSGGAFRSALSSMHRIAELVVSLDRGGRLPAAFREELAFLGEANLSNLSAVKNLMKMASGDGQHHAYVHFGSRSGLEEILPGVRIHVLGPPTLAQSRSIRKMRSRDEDEFWHLQAATGERIAAQPGPLFPDAEQGGDPPFARWFRRRLQEVRGEGLLELVRALDSAMNNTSVILLFEVGGKRLLFPGDAQIENWAFALGKPKIRDLLRGVHVYKVGHHGSLNATPKTMWNLFERRSRSRRTEDRLRSLLSTCKGKHGSDERETEVPRRPLVDALAAQTDLYSTESLSGGELFHEIALDL